MFSTMASVGLTAKLRVFVAAIATVVVSVAEIVDIDAATAVRTHTTTARTPTIR